jgi:hypothetical protein
MIREVLMDGARGIALNNNGANNIALPQKSRKSLIGCGLVGLKKAHNHESLLKK